MDKIILSDIGRRFNQHWIFKGLNYTFEKGNSYAILGANGSGKSTLLQVISTSLSPSKGSLQFLHQSQNIAIENVYRQLSMVAPYLDIVEEFTYQEAIDFHFNFKSIQKNFQKSDIFDCLNLPTHKQKEVKYFSSGMKQRLKLALAFFADTDILLLDEPTSNLDAQGEGWYENLHKTMTNNRICIISSNQEIEYRHCNHHIHIINYKN